MLAVRFSIGRGCTGCQDSDRQEFADWVDPTSSLQVRKKELKKDNSIMFYQPGKEDHGLPYDPFKVSTSPEILSCHIFVVLV